MISVYTPVNRFLTIFGNFDAFNIVSLIYDTMPRLGQMEHFMYNSSKVWNRTGFHLLKFLANREVMAPLINISICFSLNVGKWLFGRLTFPILDISISKMWLFPPSSCSASLNQFRIKIFLQSGTFR